MGFGQWMRGLFSRAAETQPVVFAGSGVYPVYPVDQLSIMKAFRGRAIDRKAALSVPAVLRGRNMICSISTLPLQQIDEQNRVQDSPFFKQLDRNTANSVMLAMTTEDLLFDAVAWWRVTEFGPDGYPAKAVRYSPQDVSLQPPADYERGHLPSDLPTEGVVWMGGLPVPFRNVIRFDSPNPAFLQVGERAVRRAIDLDEAADRYANNQRMRGFFTPADPNVDPDEDEGIEEALDAWEQARGKRVDGYVPAALTYNPVQDPTPAELQVLAQQQRADLAIANALGIDPEDLGISTTSRTYQNAIDRRKDRVNDVLAPYMSAITDRLSMPDVSQPGRSVRFWLADYLKADPKTRAEVQQLYRDMDVIDAQDIQRDEGLPPKTIESAPEPKMQVPPTQISAIPAGAQ